MQSVTAILLAAGQSRRFGARDKLLAPLAGEPLALHAARRLVEFAPNRRIAVCADRDGELASRLDRLGFQILMNPDARSGLSRSLALGIAEAARGSEAAALICLADMPFVSIDHLRRLLACFDPPRTCAVASTDGRTPMPPAVFARSLFGALFESKGDRGGKALLRQAALVAADPEELADIDRPSDIPN